MDSYPMEFRAAVLAACDAEADTKEGTKAIGLRFKVSESWIRSIKQQRRETGKIAPQTAAPRLPKWHAWSEWLLAKIAERSGNGAEAVALHYGARSDGGLLDAWLVDEVDAAALPALEAAGIAARAVPLWLRDPATSAQLAREAMES